MAKNKNNNYKKPTASNSSNAFTSSNSGNSVSDSSGNATRLSQSKVSSTGKGRSGPGGE